MTLTRVTQPLMDGQGTAAVLNVGTGASQIVQMTTAPAKLPAVDGSNLTGLASAGIFQDAERALAASNSVEWTGFSAGNTYIKIVIDGVSAGSDGSDPILQIGDAGGYETSGYVGFMRDIIGNSEDSAQTAHIPTTLAGATSKAARFCHVVVEMHKTSELTEKWLIHTSFMQLTGDTEYAVGMVSKTLSAEITQVKLFSDDSTNWSAGTAILYRDVE